MINQAEKILKYIEWRVTQHPHDIVAVAAKHFKVTRTTIHRHLSKLLVDNILVKAGTTRDITYYLSKNQNRRHSYRIQPTLSEFDVFKNDFEPVLLTQSNEIQNICVYAFTEIFNNAIDHSQGTKIQASISFEKKDVIITIQDNGIGIFKNLYDYFKLDDIRESALQLSKGKMTTDPRNHTGEGLFFSSRAMDIFEIYANNLHYIRNNKEDDWGLEQVPGKMVGSKLIMRIHKNSGQNLLEIFNRYQGEDFAFDKTDILVKMSTFGDETLISRSQAKRILRNLEKFNGIRFDFIGVRLVGQGFVDEIFRIFSERFPHIRMTYINANHDVEFMIRRGLATAVRSRNP